MPEETNVSPLIIEPQKRLQKAQLAHRLSEKISVRPGPLELIQKGIIEPDNLQLTNNIRNGRVPYEPVDNVYNINNQGKFCILLAFRIPFEKLQKIFFEIFFKNFNKKVLKKTEKYFQKI